MATLTHYHKTIRKINAAFASLFNNVILIREEANGKEDQRQIVPIVYGDKEKYVKRLEGDPELEKKIQILLPRMAYEMVGFSYDRDRKLNTNNRNFAFNPSDSDSVFAQYNPVPYDFNFALTIYTRTIEDGNQIIEQILPYFTPDFTIKINYIPEMGIIKNTPIVLNTVQHNVSADGDFGSEVRIVLWTLTFTVKGFIFGAIKEVPVIKSANTNFITGSTPSSSSSITSELRDFSGICCEGNLSRSFVMAANGCGSFIENEVVYQGISLNNATASGRVYDWNSNNRILMIKEVCGAFKLNQPISGADSLSIHIPATNAANNYIAVTLTTTATPNTASANGCWSANTTSIEY